ncbi:MAG: hypothetical protein AAGA48_11515 [Myxococcota bacterium]
MRTSALLEPPTEAEATLHTVRQADPRVLASLADVDRVVMTALTNPDAMRSLQDLGPSASFLRNVWLRDRPG